VTATLTSQVDVRHADVTADEPAEVLVWEMHATLG
jgi:hypothetical protein